MWHGAVAVDANLLVPIVACDFLLTAFDHHLFEPIVSTMVLEEVERTLIEDFPHVDPSGLRRRVEFMKLALAEQTIDAATTDLGVPTMINAKDRHVVAAAMAAEATCVVTNDEALRGEITESGIGLEPLDGDAFALRLWQDSPLEVGGVVEALIAKRRGHPVSPSLMAAQLSVHFPTMTAAWLARVDDPDLTPGR